jgi:uncharacterized protein
MKKTIHEIRDRAEHFFSQAKGSHDWDHTLRVLKLCMRIGRIEGADLEVLEIAAYLHDIGRFLQDQNRGDLCHAEKGAEIAEEILEGHPIPRDKKENILNCIRSHRFRGNQRPETLEARILFDADKLDAMGAIGIGRAFLFAGEVGAKLHSANVDPQKTAPYTSEDTGYREYRLKLTKIKDRMLTDEGRRMAEDRHVFMESFFDRFLLEHEGIK